MSGQVQLKFGSIIPGASELRVMYELSNGGTHPIYAFTKCDDLWGLLSQPPREDPTDELAQMCYAGRHTLYVFMGRVPQRLPPGVSAYAPRDPYAVKIMPGQSSRAVLRMPLPMAEWSLYNPPVFEGPQVRAIEINKIRLAAEYILEEDSLDVFEEEGLPGVYALLGSSQLVHAEVDTSDQQLLLLTHPDTQRFVPE